MRLFLAIDLPEQVRREVWEATPPLREIAPELSWVRQSKLHLTLKFLGEQPESVVAPIAKAMTDVASRHRTIELELGGIGAFPNFRRATVVWFGIAQEPRLELLHHDVETASEALGFEVDGRPFRPHLTLARVRKRAEEPVLRALARAGKALAFTTAFEVRSIDLMQSTSGAAGSDYTRLAAAPLRER